VVAAALVKAGQGSATQILTSIATRVKGFEIDPYAAWLSQVQVAVDHVFERVGKEGIER
jgi:hypothetical protein